ncbi:MAG: putative Lytic transglycosylase [Rhodospirillales bacterium]|nr:putative Lytic transglycosylase [Rhodospirillales bacterium]
MQLMPETYRQMRGEYGFGDDPFDPRDNILAGSAFLRKMLDRYGAPVFLAAYNAGPQRVDAALAGMRALPDESRALMAKISGELGLDRSGPGDIRMVTARSSGLFFAFGGTKEQAADSASWRQLFAPMRGGGENR